MKMTLFNLMLPSLLRILLLAGCLSGSVCNAAEANSDRTDFAGSCNGKSDDTAALKASLVSVNQTNHSSRIEIHIPSGVCRIAEPIQLYVGAGRSIAIRGAGKSVSVLLFDGDGLAFSLGGSGASLTLSDLTIRHNSTSLQNGTGVSVTTTTPGGKAEIADVQFDGVNRSGSWQTGARFINVGPSIQNSEFLLPDTSSNVSMIHSAGLIISGTSGSTPAQNVYAVNSRISDSIFQGGNAGVLIVGPVQGVYLNNSLSIGNQYGFYATGKPDDYPELIMLSNWHFESHLAGFFSRGFNQIMISNGLNLHFNANQDPYRGIDIGGAQFANISGTMYTGSGKGTDEAAIAVADSAFITIANNEASLVAGYFIHLMRSSHAIIVNNLGVNFIGALPERIGDCGSSINCSNNQIDGKLIQ